MKNFVFLAFTGLLTLGAVQQMNAQAEWDFFDDFEVLIGGNLGFVGGENAESFDSRLGFIAGFQNPLQVKDQIYILTCLFYAQKGASYSEESFSGDYNLSYLDAVILGEYRVSESFRLHFGPQVGILLSATDKFESNGFSGEEDVSDNTKGLDFAAAVGFSVEITNNLSGVVRYAHSLSNFYDGDDPNTTWRNRTLTFGLAYDIEDLLIPGDRKNN